MHRTRNSTSTLTY